MDEKKDALMALEKYPIESDGQGLVLKSIEAMYRFATVIEKSKLAPEGLNTKESILVALQAGAELGLRPIRSLNSFCVVKGRPTLWGDAALGLVLNSGFCEEHKEWIDGENDKMTAHCTSKRKGFAAKEHTFSVTDAIRAGLWSKAGTWKTHPQRMLIYKARGFNLRDNFSDVLCGFHIKEEFDGEEQAYNPDTPKRADRKIVDSKTDTPPENNAPPKILRDRIDELYAGFKVAVTNYNVDLNDGQVMELYLQWVSFENPGTTATDWKDPAKWTDDIVSALESAQLGHLPQPVIDMIPKPATKPEGGKNELF